MCSELCWIMVQWIPLVENNNMILFTDLDCIQGRSTSRTEVFAASLLLYIIRTSLRQVPTVDWSHSSIVTVNSSTINQDQFIALKIPPRHNKWQEWFSKIKRHVWDLWESIQNNTVNISIVLIYLLRFKISLTDSNHLLAEFSGLVIESSGQDRHGHG